MELLGFHHLTAVTGNAHENLRFYTETLGMRLVKKTVNQDDVSAYHLFYGDGAASPGSDITFFDWPAPREQRGGNSVTRTGFRVGSRQTLEWWAGRLSQVPGNGGIAIVVRDGRDTLDFEDPEGQRLSLVVDETADDAARHPWERSSVPAHHQIIGLGPIRMTVPRLQRTEKVLIEVMGMKKGRQFSLDDGKAVHVYQMGGRGPSTELQVVDDPSLPPARHGAGGVHHVAFRTPTLSEYEDWTRRLEEMRISNSGPVDRFYFRSLYFREPNGVLFEIATDGPGFATDEPLDQLGEKLSLPPFLENRRAEIEAGLREI